MVLIGGLDPKNQEPLEDIWIFDSAGRNFIQAKSAFYCFKHAKWHSWFKANF